MSFQYIKTFSEINLDYVAEVGGKNASLGEMYQNLYESGVLVPNGFAITASAYKEILTHNDAWDKLQYQLDNFNPDDVDELQTTGNICREIILNCKIPQTIQNEIIEAYKELQKEYGENLSLAVRSSATAEDSPEASFAGQNESYLNITNETQLLEAYMRCLASNFTDRSLHYKYDNNFEYMKVYLSVSVMKMVRSDRSSSGVMFSIDTETGFKDVVYISAAYGLGENIVQGTIEPDSFYVHKPTFEKGFRTVLKRKLGSKKLKMILNDVLLKDNLAVEYTKNTEIDSDEASKYSIDDNDVLTLADYAMKIEEYYSNKASKHKPMDIEWAKDAIDGKLYIVQARPETVESRKNVLQYETYALKERSKVLLTGSAIGKKIASGKVKKIKDISGMHEFKAGDVLVADITTPDWEPIMKIASAIITNKGGRTCHAAIISRELGIAAIVGTENATSTLLDEEEVTVSCAEGEEGYVYKGLLEIEKQSVDLSNIEKTKTKVMMNLGNPDLAFSLSSLPVDGIGLARMEFVINEYIKIHPMALVHPEKLDGKTQEKINMIVKGEDQKEFFVRTLSEGIATIASSVYPKPCVVRMSDFKTNEYASLLGGSFFEYDEANPMIGFRGASRYAHPNYAEGFALECEAMKRVRDEMGFTNVILMIPFCRRVAEGKQVLEAMEKNGLKRGENSLEIYVMCEIPNNVISIDGFSEIFDGFSIGSNDLTQLTLGVDRDSEIVSFDYEERDPGVLKMIEMAVEGAKRNHRHSGICGQAPSDYPEVAEFLVELGIDSISLNPDSVLKTLPLIKEIEERQKV